MAMTIKTSPELWGEDALTFTEEAERNGKLPTPKLTATQRKKLSKNVGKCPAYCIPSTERLMVSSN